MLCRGRIGQDSQGRYCIEVQSGTEIPFSSVDHLKLTLQDVPSSFVRLHISDRTPDNALLPIFLEQLHPNLLVAGKEALLQIRLTQLSDGCVLGVSVSHMLAGAATARNMLACKNAHSDHLLLPCLCHTETAGLITKLRMKLPVSCTVGAIIRG